MQLKRTHTNGALRLLDVGKEAILVGWVHRRRDHGGLIFVDLRDRWGLTQVVFDPIRDPEAHKQAEHIRNEWVIAVHGRVNARAEGMANPRLATGEIEVDCDQIEMLNESETPPFPLDEYRDVGEETRLKYRYLDMRREEIQQNLIFRSKVAAIVRNYLLSKEFVEIETPFLMKSTPEGARDFLVPSRRTFGEFYALPQSPQIYKQPSHGCRIRPVFPDHQVFPRRRSQKRPSAGIHPDRSGNELCRRRGRVCRARRSRRRDFRQIDGRETRAEISAYYLSRSNRQIRCRQARYPVRSRDC